MHSRTKFELDESKFQQVRQFRAHSQEIQNPIKTQIGDRFSWKSLEMKRQDSHQIQFQTLFNIGAFTEIRQFTLLLKNSKSQKSERFDRFCPNLIPKVIDILHLCTVLE